MEDIGLQEIMPGDGLDNRVASKLNFNFARIRKGLYDGGNKDTSSSVSIGRLSDGMGALEGRVDSLASDIAEAKREIDEGLRKKVNRNAPTGASPVSPSSRFYFQDATVGADEPSTYVKPGSDVLKWIVDTVYPVGSAYLTFNATNPSNALGGSWQEQTQLNGMHVWKRIS